MVSFGAALRRVLRRFAAASTPRTHAEIHRLTWADIDFERRTVRIKPLKGSLPRILPISLKAVEMLKNLPKKSERIFARAIYGTFGQQRRNFNYMLQKDGLAFFRKRK